MIRIALVLLVIFAITASAKAAVPERDPLAGVNPGPDAKIDILTIFAHQDDEGFYGGGTLLKLKQDPRVRLHILCLTLGDYSIAQEILGISHEKLGRIRSEELKTAAAVYDAEQVIQFQYHDGKLNQADRQTVIAEILEVIEKTGAEVIFTHDPPGITGHDDHIACSSLVTEVFPESKAQKLYYVTFPRWAYRLVYHGSMTPPEPTFKVNIHEQKKLKRMVLYSHASQKHFSEVGWLMEVVRIFNHEWIVEADTN